MTKREMREPEESIIMGPLQLRSFFSTRSYFTPTSIISTISITMSKLSMYWNRVPIAMQFTASVVKHKFSARLQQCTAHSAR